MSIKLSEEKYKGKIKDIETFVKKRWLDYYDSQEGDKAGKKGNICYIMGLPYTPHDAMHSLKIEEILSKLLPDDDNKAIDDTFSEAEKFLLLAAVWLHDIGMIPDLLPDNIKDAKELRKMHAKRASDFILTHCEGDNGDSFGLFRRGCEDLATICALHRRADRIPNDLNDKIRLIIAYLRLADALQIPERAPVNDLKEQLEFGMDPVSKYHWLKSFFVKDVIIPEGKNERFKIIIVFKKPLDWQRNAEEDMSPLVDTLLTELRDELDAVKDILMEGQIKYNLPAYIDLDYKFDPVALTDDEKADLYDLLAIIELFNPTISPNSGRVTDIVLGQIEKFADISNTETSLKKICGYWLHTLRPLLNDRPCHVYIKKVYERYKKYLTAVEIRQMDENEKKELQIDIQDLGKKLIDKRRDLKRDLPKKILDFEKVSFDKNDSILVYGYSGSVIMLLDALSKEKMNNITIYVCAGTSKNKHRYNNRLIYADGITYLNKMTSIGIKNVHYIPDLASSHLFSPRFSVNISFENDLNNDIISDELRERFKSKGFLLEKPSLMRRRDIWTIIELTDNGEKKYTIRKESNILNVYSPDKITMVLFGANGIDENTGEIAHSLGHLGIADMASVYKIPIYVIAESMKIGELGNNSISSREGPWYPTDVQVVGVDETVSYNPREERVPREKITAIVTEKGIAYLQESLGGISSNIGKYPAPPEGID